MCRFVKCIMESICCFKRIVIENGVNFPSMDVFFYICDYLDITPMEFFDVSVKNPTKSKELIDATKNLSSEQLEHLIAIAKGLK